MVVTAQPPTQPSTGPSARVIQENVVPQSGSAGSCSRRPTRSEHRDERDEHHRGRLHARPDDHDRDDQRASE